MNEFSNEVQLAIFSLLPPGKKRGHTGWWQFNCPVCHHVGPHRPDSRGRGQVIFSKGGVFAYCHNCHFKTGWTPGGIFGKKISMYLEALGAEHETIQKLQLISLQMEEMTETEQILMNPELKPKRLPKGTKSFSEWATEKDPPEKFLEALNYVNNRNPKLLELVEFHWCSETVGRKDGRVIIPIKYQGEILGTSARWFDGPLNGRPKYVNDVPSGLLYNADLLDDPFLKYLILVEGSLDAAAINGVGILKNRITEQQFKWLHAADKKIVVLADRDKAGSVLIDQAIEHEWMVSFPNWEGVKDAEEATRKYGRVFTVDSILNSAVEGEMMIGVKRSSWL